MPKKKTVSQQIFQNYALQTDPKLCFVLMPFRPDLDEIYQDVVKPVATQTPVSMKCLRADEIYSANEIMQDVWNYILSARIIIADLTRRNPNVMYELGISHALGKKAILLTQDMGDVPFDLRHIRCIVYDRGPRGIANLRRQLGETMQSILAEPIVEAYRVIGELSEVQRLSSENRQLIQEAKRLEARKLLRGRDDAEPLERLAAGAQDLFISGPTLAIVAMRQEFLRRKVEDGCRVRLVVPEPDPSSPAIKGLLDHWHTPPEGFLSEVKSALANFRILSRSISKYAAGSFELRFLRFAVTLTLLMIDGHTDKGYLRVELLPFNTASADRPHLELRPSDDPYWYPFFRDRCDQLWDHAYEVNADSLPSA